MAKKQPKQLVEESESDGEQDNDRELSEPEEEGNSSDEDREREEASSSDEDEEEGEGRDGMADMMAKILHQQVDGKVPVLAKRKTTIMKELEKEKSNKDRLKLVRKQKKEDKGKFLVVPDHTTTDYERQLRKVATRGVVALFNAITKAKREEHESENQDVKSVVKKSKAAEVGALSRVNFVSLLQKEARQKETAGQRKVGGARSSSSSSLLQSGEVDKNLSLSLSSVSSSQQKSKHVNNDDDNDSAEDSDGNSDNGEGRSKGEVGEQKKGWHALQDSFLVDRKLALKDWDKDDVEDEGGSEDSEDDDIGKRPNPNSKIEDPFRELSDKILQASGNQRTKKGSDKGKKGKKRNLDDSSDGEEDGDYKKKYPKKKSSKK